MEQDELLEDIFSAYYDARKGKRNTKSQVRFERHLSDNLTSLYKDVKYRRYKVGRSICFVFNKPVKREVFAANFRDRVIHHYLFNKLSPLLEQQFIYDSYSCRKGKGTFMGIERLEHHIRSCSDNYKKDVYVLKLDIQGYFMTINKEILYQIITSIIDKKIDKCDFDVELVKYLLKETVFSDPTKNCYVKGDKSDWKGLPKSKSLFYSPAGCGLPIGNLTSQLFSNVYLNVFDQYMKRELHVKHYGRYVDDFFLVSESKEQLLSYIPLIRDFLKNNLGLTLHPRKIYLQPVRHGVQFLGAYVKPYHRYAAKRYISSMYHELGRVYSEETNPYVSIAKRNSYRGHLSHFDNMPDNRYLCYFIKTK